MRLHPAHGLATPTSYERLLSLVTSRKDHIVSAALKLIASHYAPAIRSWSTTKAAAAPDEFDRITRLHVAKLQQLCISGKCKQAKHAVHVLATCWTSEEERASALDAVYARVIEQLTQLQQQPPHQRVAPRTFLACLVSLGHLCQLAPAHAQAKHAKEFISKSVVKDILMRSSPHLDFLSQTSSFNASGASASASSSSSKRVKRLAAGTKWCANEDELPVATRIRIECVKLVVRWALGLKQECHSAPFVVRMLAKLIKENSAQPQKTSAADTTGSEHATTSNANATTDEAEASDASEAEHSVSEAERARLRCVCASQLLKLAQEASFKAMIAPDIFHTLARLVVDACAPVRDICIRKLQRGLSTGRLSVRYMGVLTLCGLDTNRERKTRVKKLYTALVKKMRMSPAASIPVVMMKPSAGNSTAIASNSVRLMPEVCRYSCISQQYIFIRNGSSSLEIDQNVLYMELAIDCMYMARSHNKGSQKTLF